jgi:hypothetical protein
MLAVSGGKLMMLSTPHGQRGVFFEAWDHGTEWKRYRVPATECPRISLEFLEEERLTLGNWWYRQEYFCEFLDTYIMVLTNVPACLIVYEVGKRSNSTLG